MIFFFFFKHVFILVDKLLLIPLADDTKEKGWQILESSTGKS